MKKFTKGCAVDVRCMSEVMFNAIKRVIPYPDNTSTAQFNIFGFWKFLIVIDGKLSLSYSSCRNLELLTPTDILGPELVKAIEEGYTPWFDGDDEPVGVCRVVLANGEFVKTRGSNWSWSKHNEEDDIIAYKLSDSVEPSIESKTLSEKVGNHNHYFKDVSHLEILDVYRVIDLFAVTNPCHQHAIKKILCCGQRGAKDAAKDTQEAIDSLKRALEMMREDDVRN